MAPAIGVSGRNGGWIRVSSCVDAVLARAVRPKCSCGNRAAALVQVHKLDYCTEDEPVRELWICAAHRAEMVAMVSELVLMGGQFCSTCFLPIVKPCDMLVMHCQL